MKMLLTLLLSVLASASPTLAPANDLPLRGFILCLDPGHPSEAGAGTVSPDGRLTERHVNWVVALRLRELLVNEGATVVMTKRSEGEVVTNRRRAEIANAAHAHLLLRLHCDAASQSGLATFYPDRQGTAHGRTGPSQSVIAGSRRAALRFHPAVIAALDSALPSRGIQGDSQTAIGGRQGALTGSIFSCVPALTVEMCVLTNEQDYAFIRTQAGQEKMARALLAGVESDAGG